MDTIKVESIDVKTTTSEDNLHRKNYQCRKYVNYFVRGSFFMNQVLFSTSIT